MLDFLGKEEVELANALLPGDRYDVTYLDAAEDIVTPETLAKAHVLMTRSRPVTAEMLAQAPNLKLVQKYGGRPDRLDLDAARNAQVQIAVMPLRGCIAVAELAMTLVLALSKQLVTAHEVTVSGAYRDLGIEPKLTSQRVHAFQWMKLPNLQEVSGKTLGIVGFGEIGTEVSRRANAFGMKVLYYKREALPADMETSLGVTYAPLEELLAASDFVTLHVPHGDSTDRLIGAEQLALMKPSAYLVNTCRGPVVDENALIEALEHKRIAGAGLDVFDYEPLPHDNRLTQLDNVILTPHIGGGTGGAREKQLTDVLSNIVRFGDGEPLQYQIV
jgi:phosphoglycerate dehydrogenase-like enzyme